MMTANTTLAQRRTVKTDVATSLLVKSSNTTMILTLPIKTLLMLHFIRSRTTPLLVFSMRSKSVNAANTQSFAN